ncbi:MAG: hypothetical protein NC484_09270 [Alloprevotella sp.]|nr:hypothetical protein [Alloprevotella sp.]
MFVWHIHYVFLFSAILLHHAMLSLRRAVSFAAALSIIFIAQAQKSLVDIWADSLAASHKIVYIDGKPLPADHSRYVDSVRMVISNFYYDQFRHFQDPEAPYFLFMSKDAQLAMGIGGAVRMRGYFDWGGAIPASGFAPFLIPMTPDPAGRRQFGTTPAGTSLYFRVIGRNKVMGNYQLYIETNFNGYQSRGLHLKKAYAMINDFTIGYASSTFSDPAAIPPTVDAQGPNNKITPTHVLIRYMPSFGRFSVGVSAETPDTEVAVDGVNTSRVSSYLPEGAALLQYQWARGQHIRLAGIVRSLPYRDLINQSNHNLLGWGIQISSVTHPAPPLTTYITASYGKGYQQLGGDMQIGSYDLVPYLDTPGRLYAPAGFGWCLGVQYNFRPNLFVSISASQSRYLPSSRVGPDDYKYGLMGAANIFWNLTPRMQVAAEFDWGIRHNFSGTHKAARRVGALCQFSF